MLEAMACKTPVVTTNLPELRELWKNNEDVIMAAPGNTKSLVNKINLLLKDKKLRKDISINAYNKSKKFDLRVITKEFKKLYSKLI